jgi:hypothetical protein
MDPISLAAGMINARVAAIQMAAAVRIMKTNPDGARAAAQVVDAAQQNMNRLANVAAGVGQNLDISV